jgi:hypothetical protein
MQTSELEEVELVCDHVQYVLAADADEGRVDGINVVFYLMRGSSHYYVYPVSN